MSKSVPTSVYQVPSGMPLSVFNDRYSRIVDGVQQGFTERVTEMVMGNTSLDDDMTQEEIDDFTSFAVAGITPLSGRHLQHGDKNQKTKNIEVFTNCSTTPFSFLSFYLLLNGSGVGRDYSSESCRVDWDYMPNVRIVLDGGSDDDGDVAKGAHPDWVSAFNEFQSSFESLKEAKHKYDAESEDVRWIKVRDSREGWAEAIAILETAAFHKNHADSLFIFDFSDIRPAGSPIKGMQNKPAQGPVPLMRAMAKLSTIKGARMKPWKQALFIDHILASIVVMGMVRRAARIATKSWSDRDVIEFIDIKRGGFLWSANNSILTDEEFWEQAKNPKPSHARRVFEAAVGAAYYDETGEPGFLNTHLLNENKEGFDKITIDSYLNSNYDFKLHQKTFEMIEKTLTAIKRSKYPFICNPCAEIVLSKFGGYCVIGDVVLKYSESKEMSKKAVALTARALVRTNLMNALYKTEVERTNRIGVGITGIFEYAWSLFGLTFKDLISVYDHVFDSSAIEMGDEPNQKVMEFWNHIDDLRITVEKSAAEYSHVLGLNPPHTATTIKPSGTISKVMACTEAAHLPPYSFYVRWVICEKNSEKHMEYVSRGYPVKDVSHQYHNCVVIGFPTKHPIADIMGPENVIMADEVIAEDQFKWVSLLERFWFGPDKRNNQVSYTLKYDNKKVSHDEYLDIILKWQPKVRCCAVMPFTDESAYAYLPEEKITEEKYYELMALIDPKTTEEYSEEELMCDGGACPIEDKIN
jgi:adenosylcobalamin-dependent ribonucleoside-triphosphate reductase